MTLALLGSPARKAYIVDEDPHGRQPYEHPATEGMEVLNGDAKAHLLHPTQMARLGRQYGIEKVIRWNPRNVSFHHRSASSLFESNALPASKSEGIWGRHGSYTSGVCNCWSRRAGERRWRSASAGARADHPSARSARECITKTKRVVRSIEIIMLSHSYSCLVPLTPPKQPGRYLASSYGTINEFLSAPRNRRDQQLM